MNIYKEGSVYTGEYRNLFQENGMSEEEIRQRLDDTWNELFYGAPDVRIYHTMDNDMGYIVDTGNTDVRTEGMSYGMMMAVQMDKKEEFDRLWKFAKVYMQHTEGRYKDYFCLAL